MSPRHRGNPATVRSIYENELTQRGYAPDEAQYAAVQVLDVCSQAWRVYAEKRSSCLGRLFDGSPVPRGVYLYGDVGRGKSFLMDCFFKAVPIGQKTRLHFHEFMREVHRELREMQGAVNPLDSLGRRISQRFRLICFDEFHISDITDAMILHRLLQALQKYKVGLVMTSNFKPEALYPNGLNRDRIQGAIDLLNQSFDVVCINGGVDYRANMPGAQDVYFCPLNQTSFVAMQGIFHRLIDQTKSEEQEPVLWIQSHKLNAYRRAEGVIWFEFQNLCEAPCHPNDYLEIAAQFHTVLLSGVPKLLAHHAAPARRLMWLIDVLYDRRVKLVMSAATRPEQLYLEASSMPQEFSRTVSRLHEMQSKAYLEQAHRQVDTALAYKGAL